MIKIVIAEDQQMLLGAFGSLLNLEEDMEVVGKASNGEEAVALVKNFSLMSVLWISKCQVRAV